MHRKSSRFFSQYCSIDALLSKRILDASGYSALPLSNSILYRGDTRSPEGINGIFKTGFYRQIEDPKCENPKIKDDHTTVSCVSTSKDLVYAVGFADCPATTGGFFGKSKETYSWVYMLFSDKGIDLTIDRKLHTKIVNYAKHVKEVALTGVPPENILAAFQIKTTKNTISAYLGSMDSFIRTNSPSQWQLLITDWKINNNCFLIDSDPDLFTKVISEFKVHHTKGYYRIPWSPNDEEKDFPVTYNMKVPQKAAYRLGITKSKALKIRSMDQVEGLKLGFQIEDVISDEFSQFHLNAFKAGIPLKRLRKATSVEAFGFLLKIDSRQLKGLKTTSQVMGMAMGFSKEFLISKRFNDAYCWAVELGYAASQVEKSSYQEVLHLIKETQDKSLNRMKP